jgi:hypothetical protein
MPESHSEPSNNPGQAIASAFLPSVRECAGRQYPSSRAALDAEAHPALDRYHQVMITLPAALDDGPSDAGCTAPVTAA